MWPFTKKKKKEVEVLNQNQIAFPSDGLDDRYLFDFKNWSSGYNGIPQPIGNFVTGGSDSGEVEIKKLVVKPKDVLNELETIPTPFTLNNLDDKIAILKDKAKLIVQYYAKREVDALIFRLENRKKYLEFRSFFDDFQNTTDEKIETLLTKYDLVMKTSDIFIPEFPDEAITTMKEYTEQMDKLCGKKPVFYVIAQPDKFQKAYQKRDPILLVQSPFGFYWQILGAWDEEMILLSEL